MVILLYSFAWFQKNNNCPGIQGSYILSILAHKENHRKKNSWKN